MSDSDSAPEELTFSESKQLANKRQLNLEKVKHEQKQKLRQQRRLKDEKLKAQQPTKNKNKSKKLSEILAESESEDEVSENTESKHENENENEHLVFPHQLPMPGIQTPKIKPQAKKTLFKDGTNLVKISKPKKSAPPGRIASSKRDQLMYRKLSSA